MNAITSTILDQLGGSNFSRFLYGMGMVCHERSLIAHLCPNPKRVYALKIELVENDAYTLTVYRQAGISPASRPMAVWRETDVRANLLQDRVEALTGLYVTLHARTA